MRGSSSLGDFDPIHFALYISFLYYEYASKKKSSR